MENRLQKTFDAMDVLTSAVKANPMVVSKMIAKLKTFFKSAQRLDFLPYKVMTYPSF